MQATGVGELLRRGTAEEQTDCDCAGVQTVLLAACNIAEHAAWRKKLQSCANAAHAAALAARRHEAAPLLMASESCFDAGVPGVAASLCSSLSDRHMWGGLFCAAAGSQQEFALLRRCLGWCGSLQAQPHCAAAT